MLWGGVLAALTEHFHKKRPWEGWLNAFQRGIRVIAGFFFIIMAAFTVVYLYGYYVTAPREAAREERVDQCRQAQAIPVPVTYPGGPLTYIPRGVTEQCETEVR